MPTFFFVYFLTSLKKNQDFKLLNPFAFFK